MLHCRVYKGNPTVGFSSSLYRTILYYTDLLDCVATVLYWNGSTHMFCTFCTVFQLALHCTALLYRGATCTELNYIEMVSPLPLALLALHCTALLHCPALHYTEMVSPLPLPSLQNSQPVAPLPITHLSHPQMLWWSQGGWGFWWKNVPKMVTSNRFVICNVTFS